MQTEVLLLPDSYLHTTCDGFCPFIADRAIYHAAVVEPVVPAFRGEARIGLISCGLKAA